MGRRTARRLIVLWPCVATLAQACDEAAPPVSGGAAASAAPDAAIDAGPAIGDASIEATPAPRDAASSDAAIDAPVYGAGCLPAIAPSPPGAGFVLVADSVAGFGDAQGRCGWRYGFTTPSAPSAFEEMTQHDDAGVWWVADGTYWTLVGSDWQHPNGTVTCCGRAAVEQWAVRRWSSNVAGPVVIAATARKREPFGVGGNGVVLRVVVDGEPVHVAPIGAADVHETVVVANAVVAIGSTIDLVLDPFEGDDLADSTRVEARVWR